MLKRSRWSKLRDLTADLGRGLLLLNLLHRGLQRFSGGRAAVVVYGLYA